MYQKEEEFQFPKMTEEEFFEGTKEEWEAEKLRRRYMQENLSKGEKAHYILGAVAGGLIIAGTFLIVFFFFLLFATKVWLG